jgi:large-conductance mechanosensitive channel
MRGLKVAAAGIGILIALIVGWAVVGFVLHAVEFIVIAALVVGAVFVAIKVANAGKQVTRKRADREVRREPEPEYSRSLPRTDIEPAPSYQPTRASSQDIDDELARLKREMGA